MPEIDTRFLTVHPRTRLWWEQRKQCTRCRNCTVTPIGDPWRNSGGGWVCTATNLACMESREPHSKCGPDAQLFEEA